MSNNYAHIKLRRGTAAEWAASAPQPGGEVLKLGEPGFETDSRKLKIGDGVTPWNNLPYVTGGSGGAAVIVEDIDHLVNQLLVPGSGISLSFSDANNQLIIATTGLQPAGNYSAVGHNHIIADVSGLQTALDGKQAAGNYTLVGHNHIIADVSGLQTALDGKQAAGNYSLSDHTHTSESITDFASAVSGVSPVKSVNGMTGDVVFGGLSNYDHLNDLDDVSISGAIEGQVLKYNGSVWTNDNDGLATITIPAVSGETYKGLQASYGRIYSNSSSNELNVSKIVIHKPANTTTTIDPTSSSDNFRVSGLENSDILAMFVVYGDANGPKELNILQAFTESIIDNIILASGVEGSYNSLQDMRSEFYSKSATISSAASGLYVEFDFFQNYYNELTTTGGSGSGFAININRNDTNGAISNSSISNPGSGYSIGNTVVISGNQLGGSTPDNDVSITIDNVDESGLVLSFTIDPSATIPGIWPSNNISDGGVDQYDTANYISTNLYNQINYNNGNIVADGSDKFGIGSSYSFAYIPGIFALFVTGNKAVYVETSGNSGADGSSLTDSGSLYQAGTPSQTFENAIGYINLTSNPYVNTEIYFVSVDNGDEVDILIPDDGSGSGVGITRDGNSGIYNPYRESGWDSDVSPDGTLWNIDGWSDLSDVTTRNYTNLYQAFGSGGLGNKIVGTECIMYLPDNDSYYMVKFTQWTQGGNGGGFAYNRRLLDTTQLIEGIRFADGTRLTSASGVGRVKSTASNSRRIEEVYGNKTVSVTAVTTNNITSSFSRSGNGNAVWVDTTTTNIDEIMNNPSASGVIDYGTIQFSLDNNTWYAWNGSTSFDGNERGYGLNTTSFNHTIGDTVYFRYNTGGAPQVWWNKNDLPGGPANFRGATIDYHCYTGEGTFIGTIHIVDDDGEENITHTEVSSGSTDSENDDLWFVDPNAGEGTVSYRRMDGESKTAKFHWSAKVFYGSELYD